MMSDNILTDYIRKQDVIDMLIERIADINDYSYPNLSHEMQDAVKSFLSDIQYDIENI